MGAMVDGLRDTALQQAQASGWNGIFERWEAKDVKTQVVAGMNYFVKVAISDAECVHLRIHKPLPHTGKPAELHGIKLGQDHATDVSYFQDSAPPEMPDIVRPVGGLGETKSADDEVQAMVDGLRDTALQQAQASGW